MLVVFLIYAGYQIGITTTRVNTLILRPVRCRYHGTMTHRRIKPALSYYKTHVLIKLIISRLDSYRSVWLQGVDKLLVVKRTTAVLVKDIKHRVQLRPIRRELCSITRTCQLLALNDRTNYIIYYIDFITCPWPLLKL